MKLEVYGHKQIIDSFWQGFQRDKLSHSYIFYGVDAIGKKTTIHYLAQKIFCQSEDAEKRPCGECSFCHQIYHHSFPDFFILEAEEGKRIISIEQVREFQKKLQLKPYYGKMKIFVIDEAEKMNREAANALLKTLEEPPVFSLIILITSQINRLLKTIISRCQNIRFKEVIFSEVRDKFREEGFSDDEVKEIWQLSNGKIGEAFKLFSDKDYLKQIREEKDLFVRILEDSLSQRLKMAEKLAKKNREEIQQFLGRFLIWYRNKIIEPQEKVEKLKKKLLFLKYINQVYKEFNYNINRRLGLETLMVNVP